MIHLHLNFQARHAHRAFVCLHHLCPALDPALLERQQLAQLLALFAHQFFLEHLFLAAHVLVVRALFFLVLFVRQICWHLDRLFYLDRHLACFDRGRLRLADLRLAYFCHLADQTCRDLAGPAHLSFDLFYRSSCLFCPADFADRFYLAYLFCLYLVCRLAYLYLFPDPFYRLFYLAFLVPVFSFFLLIFSVIHQQAFYYFLLAHVHHQS